MQVIYKKTKKTKFINAARGLTAATLVLSGAIQHNNDGQTSEIQTPVTTQTVPSRVAQKNQKEMTFGEYREMMKPLTPYIMVELILTEGVKLDSTGKWCVPYQDSRGVWTIAFGITNTRDGKSVNENTAPMPIADAWDESVHFLENRETYFMMYCYDVGCDSLDLNAPGRLCAFASIFYNASTKLMEKPENKNHRNRNETLRNLYKKYGDNVTPEMVRECFAKYPVVEPRSFGELAMAGASDKELADILGTYLVGGRGMWSRRWVEGQILMGNINPKSFLNLPMGTLSEFMKLMGNKKSVFWNGNKNSSIINMTTLVPFDAWLSAPVAHDGKTKFKKQTIGELLNNINPKVLKQLENDKTTFSMTDKTNNNKTVDFISAKNEFIRRMMRNKSV